MEGGGVEGIFKEVIRMMDHRNGKLEWRGWRDGSINWGSQGAELLELRY